MGRQAPGCDGPTPAAQFASFCMMAAQKTRAPWAGEPIFKSPNCSGHTVHPERVHLPHGHHPWRTHDVGEVNGCGDLEPRCQSFLSCVFSPQAFLCSIHVASLTPAPMEQFCNSGADCIDCLLMYELCQFTWWLPVAELGLPETKHPLQGALGGQRGCCPLPRDLLPPASVAELGRAKWKAVYGC